uniref:Uncharacterized protein n=1 Tax=Arion vulgaris TaxID=1028688 RepID=A0A0B7BMY8_9EUPU
MLECRVTNVLTFLETMPRLKRAEVWTELMSSMWYALNYVIWASIRHWTDCENWELSVDMPDSVVIMVERDDILISLSWVRCEQVDFWIATEADGRACMGMSNVP